VYIEGELTNFFSILDMSFKFFNEIKWLVLTQKKSIMSILLVDKCFCEEVCCDWG